MIDNYVVIVTAKQGKENTILKATFEEKQI